MTTCSLALVLSRTARRFCLIRQRLDCPMSAACCVHSLLGALRFIDAAAAAPFGGDNPFASAVYVLIRHALLRRELSGEL